MAGIGTPVRYLVMVATGLGSRPDLRTLKAFVVLGGTFHSMLQWLWDILICNSTRHSANMILNMECRDPENTDSFLQFNLSIMLFESGEGMGGPRQKMFCSGLRIPELWESNSTHYTVTLSSLIVTTLNITLHNIKCVNRARHQLWRWCVAFSSSLSG
jgi:hypothetical protein